MNILVYIICLVAMLAMGTLDIRQAVISFEEGRYGWFGWYIMNALWMSVLLAKCIWIGFGG